MTIKAKKKKKKRHKPSNPSGLHWGGRRAAAEQKAWLGTLNADSLPTCFLQLGVFTKLHKPHKPQKPHQNRLQNGITAPHRK